MEGKGGGNSEVSTIMAKITREYEAAQLGIVGLAQRGRHAFVATCYENLGQLQIALEDLVGKDASMALVITALDGSAEQTGSTS